jgi:demethylmenaquinone methyltransferase/2-methoxy-6-polyprenyl-1,4-benzoquinol methylase
MNKRIQNLFSKVPDTYELVNHVLTFGFDIRWRKKLVRAAAKAGGERFLDVCTGTGETAAYLSRRIAPGRDVYATDFSLPMLRMVRRKPEGAGIKLVMSDIRHMPFPDRFFDVVTLSFATRNINVNRDLFLTALGEIRRVLKEGGVFINLETSQPQNGWIKKLFHAYVRFFVVPVGAGISGSKPAYAYLAGTIPRFYDPGSLSAVMTEAGFEPVTYKKMLFGIAAMHWARSPRAARLPDDKIID